jgi:hypothetical protein
MAIGHLFQTAPNDDVIRAIPWVKEQLEATNINLV